MKANGIMANMSVMKPKSEQAHWIPKLPYIWGAARGRQTAVIDRMVLIDAWAEAENSL